LPICAPSACIRIEKLLVRLGNPGGVEVENAHHTALPDHRREQGAVPAGLFRQLRPLGARVVREVRHPQGLARLQYGSGESDAGGYLKRVAQHVREAIIVCAPRGMNAQHTVSFVETPVLSCGPPFRLADGTQRRGERRLGSFVVQQKSADAPLETKPALDMNAAPIERWLAAVCAGSGC
jgi:hypothetical protein